MLRDAGRWRPGEPDDLDAHDWWWRTTFAAAPGDAVLELGGLATLADVWLNGEHVLESASMFVSHAVDVEALLRAEGNELRIRCRALAPELAVPRKPRARWRTKLADNALRWQRTMLLGRTPGIAGSPAAVGPWRPVTVGPRRVAVSLLARLDGDDGVLAVRASAPVEVELAGQRVAVDGEGELRIAGVERWWPHTHGEPVLHEVVVRADGEEVARRRVGFRERGGGAQAWEVNGVPVFARGAVWTPADPVDLWADDATLRALLERVRDAGMNVLRVVGTGAYEDTRFLDLCDELGILVWQDLMFANLDYPIADDGFRALVEREAREQLARVAGRPCLAMLCGNSEVSQQVAMLGLEPELGVGELFGELLPRWAAEAGCDVPYVPSAPSGGALPFRNDEGVAHWFGVGGYRRPLTDARRAGVRFAAECLAFANVGDDGDESWVPGDAGADWDFGDVTRHYARELYGTEEARRLAPGEAMAEVFGEWRRAASPCGGGIVLWLRDREPGAGWGILDWQGRPKAAWHRLRDVLAPVAVWTTDEGQNGIAVHAANDTPEPVSTSLRVALYHEGTLVGEASEDVTIPAHGSLTRDVEGMLGRFADVTWAYRFGPPQQDLVVAELAGHGTAFRFPVGVPVGVDPGLEVHRAGAGVELTCARPAVGVRVVCGDVALADALCLEPGRPRLFVADGPVRVTALNVAGTLDA